MIALIDFLYLGSIEDMTSISVFVCVGVLTGFFSKNMIIILSLTVIITNVIKYGGISKIIMKEGFTNEENEDEDNEDEDNEENEDEDDNKNKKKTLSKTTKIKVIKSTEKDSEVEPKSEGSEFTQVNNQPIDDQERMLMANEKLLERMNKYKPLLDTLQGITKNIAVVKSMTVSKKDD
jgi:ABC-type Zn2+ transport system substrate-binding protein/surface adhesin